MNKQLAVLAAGFPSVDRIFGVKKLPGQGETVPVTFLDDATHAGGCGVNVAMGLTRIGVRAGAACVIGTDPDGKAFLQHLEHEGIDTQGITVVEGARSSRSYLFSDPDGNVVNFFYPGAAGELEGEPDLSQLPECRLGLITVGPANYNRAFLRTLRGRGTPVALQMRIDREAYDPLLAEALQNASILLMNHHEAAFLVAKTGVTRVADLLGETTHMIVVTHGAAGAEAWTRHGHWFVPAVAVQRVADTTGAGDAFTAGFLSGLLWELPTEAALHIGATMAAFAVEQVGAQEGLPVRQQLADRIAKTGEGMLARQLLAFA